MLGCIIMVVIFALCVFFGFSVLGVPGAILGGIIALVIISKLNSM